MKYRAVVIGTSAGGMEALKEIFENLDKSFVLPIIIVQHISPYSTNYLPEYLQKFTHLKVKEVDEKEKIERGFVYITPPNYHTLIELDETFSLSIEGRVSYARPSIDVLFQSAAYCYREKLIGIILTGGNFDGASGMKLIEEKNGYSIVQNPEGAEIDSMPRAVIESCRVNYIGDLKNIAEKLNCLKEER